MFTSSSLAINGSLLVTERSNQHCSPKFTENISSQCITSIEGRAKILYCFVSRVWRGPASRVNYGIFCEIENMTQNSLINILSRKRQFISEFLSSTSAVYPHRCNKLVLKHTTGLQFDGTSNHFREKFTLWTRTEDVLCRRNRMERLRPRFTTTQVHCILQGGRAAAGNLSTVFEGVRNTETWNKKLMSMPETV